MLIHLSLCPGGLPKESKNTFPIHTHTHTHTHTPSCTRTHTHGRIHTHVRTLPCSLFLKTYKTYTHTHTYTRTNTHPHTHTHTRVYSVLSYLCENMYSSNGMYQQFKVSNFRAVNFSLKASFACKKVTAKCF